MNIFVFFFVLLVLNLCEGEVPKFSCGDSKPFKNKNNLCSNYTDVCVKKNDKDCESFLGICEQCPTTKYSVLKLILKDVALIKDTIYTLLWVTITINITLLVILLLEIRFKIITKLMEYCKIIKDKRKAYNILGSRKTHQKNSNIDTKLIEIIYLLQNLKEMTKQKTKFRINGQATPIELHIEKFDNIIQLKKKISYKLSQPDDYKLLKLKYNGKLLDDNAHLSEFQILNGEICCEFDRSMDASNIVVVKLTGNISLPQIIQISKSQTISDLKKIISRFHSVENCKVFIENKEKKDKKELKEVLNEMEIKECNLLDDECIQIISKKLGDLVITSIFDERETSVIEYSNIDSVLSLKSTAAAKFNCKPNDFVLFLHNKKLDENKFAFEYFTENNLPIKFCKLMKLDGIEIEKQPLTEGRFSSLFKGRFIKRNMNILIEKYQISLDLEENTHIVNELKTYQITKSHRRFVKLFGVYIDENSVYVAMENMAEGSMKMFLKKNETIEEKDIAKWSFQILEGLKYLHENNIIHRDLNPSSLLLNSSKDIKLSGFNLSKDVEFHEPRSPSNLSSLVITDDGRMAVKYFAPEIIKNDKYDGKADVWSFGAILINITTKKDPYPKKDNNAFIRDIKASKYYDDYKYYDYEDHNYQDNTPERLQRFIESCMKGNPEERATIENLLSDEFLKKLVRNEM